MAKVPFSKLQAKADNAISKNFYRNLAGEEIYYEVKHYLPFKEKLDLISTIINNSIDDRGFYNPMRVKFNMVLETVYAYTNLSFTDKMKEDPFKLYDIIISTGIFADIINIIQEKDWVEIQEGVWSTIKNIYDYRNSAAGILEMVTSDYDALNLDANNIVQALNDPTNMTLLKDVMHQLG